MIRKTSTYSPEAHRVDESPELVVGCGQDVVYITAVSPESGHSRRGDLVLGLTGQHQRHQNLEPVVLQGEQKRGLWWYN